MEPTYEARTVDLTRRGEERSEELYNEIRMNHMSGRGELNLPESLERARWEYMLPDETFSMQAAFSSVLVAPFMAKGAAEKFYEDGSIIMPDTMADAIRNETPRGLIVGAGLKAMDILKSNGILLGDVIFYVRHAPPIVQMGSIRGKPIYLMSLHVAEIRGSRDAMLRIREGKMRLVELEFKVDGVLHREHVFEMDGEVVSPIRPEEPETVFE